jgi:hypothetical protein
MTKQSLTDKIAFLSAEIKKIEPDHWIFTEHWFVTGCCIGGTKRTITQKRQYIHSLENALGWVSSEDQIQELVASGKFRLVDDYAVEYHQNDDTTYHKIQRLELI